MAQKTILRVVLASPGDVQAERDAVQPVIDELNEGIADTHGLRLEVGRWETDTYPGLHIEGAQGVVDSALKIEDCDVLIGIFWTKFGTATPSGETGTEHEIRLAARSWEAKKSPRVMLYFSKKSINPLTINTDQLGQVSDFRKEFEKKGLYSVYSGLAQFRELLRKHLTKYLKDRYENPT